MPLAPPEALNSPHFSVSLHLIIGDALRISGSQETGCVITNGITRIQIYAGSSWENVYKECFNGTLRRETLNAEWFSTVNRPITGNSIRDEFALDCLLASQSGARSAQRTP